MRWHCLQVDHTPAETCEIFFFLYDTESSSQISERFIKHVVGSTSYLTKEEEETYTCEKSSIIFTVSLPLRGLIRGVASFQGWICTVTVDSL